MTQLFYKCLSWSIPYRVYHVDLALPYEAIAHRLDQLESRGMQIHSPSRFNQGSYHVKKTGQEVQVRGPYGERRFPLHSQISLQPLTGSRTSLRIVSRPTIRALAPICLGFLPFMGFILWFITQDRPVSLGLVLLLLYPYGIILLFFNIEMGILVKVLQDHLHEMT